jgi:hypothetical protein
MNLLRVFSPRGGMPTCSMPSLPLCCGQSGAAHDEDEWRLATADHRALHRPWGSYQLSDDAVAGAILLQPGPPVMLWVYHVLLATNKHSIDSVYTCMLVPSYLPLYLPYCIYIHTESKKASKAVVQIQRVSHLTVVKRVVICELVQGAFLLHPVVTQA